MNDHIDKYIAEKNNQDTVPFDFELYQAGLMDMPKEMIEVLDKIRAEIEQMNNIDYIEPVTVDEVLKIIDKYKTESESRE